MNDDLVGSELDQELEAQVRAWMQAQDSDRPLAPELGRTDWKEVALAVARLAGSALYHLGRGVAAVGEWIAKLEAPAQFFIVAVLMFAAMFGLGRCAL